MKFHVAVIEPKNYPFGHFLDYPCKLISCGLESLGHECTIGYNQIEPSRTNILVGSHNLSSPQDLDTISQACRYIVYQTEILSADKLNTWASAQQAYQQVYLPCLKRAHAVWEGTVANLPFLEALGVRTQTLLGGYHPAMEEVVPKRTKDIDFAFFGSVTEHRRNLLTALRQRGQQVVIAFDVRAMFRNDLIGRTKVNLEGR